ncbi:alkaline phosphatase D family protein [Terrarubrum flagellatum]|uniref:alkaline phosphatase D family protein n=1 Tax=Terrirubrum flagellatum TaxID=2895980 RepID=UPI003144E1E6
MLHRRRFIASAAGAGALTLPAYLRRATAQTITGFNPFVFSVASGDPTADAVVLWTRLARAFNDLSPIGEGPVAVEWVLAEDEGLKRVVRSGVATAVPEFGHSVHVDAQGLDSDRAYWFMFRTGGKESPVGRTRTLPRASAAPTTFHFNVASCQHWENGYFNAYDGMKDDDAAFVLHLGDYIYETGRGGARQHESKKAPATLAEYRLRHALYKTDAALRRIHETTPFIAVLDNHDALEFDTDDPAELRRRAAAYQAWCEFMPTRSVINAMSPTMAIAREVDIGGLLRMTIPDTRQFRASHEICLDGSDPKFAFGVYKKFCAAADAPERSMLGRPQEIWLEDRLKNSKATWNAIATTVMMTPFDLDHDGALYRYLAAWDGYPANRARILDAIANNKVRNPISLSGDIHSSLVSSVVRKAGDDPAQGLVTEFVGTSISSVWPEPLAKPMRDALPKNPHLSYFDPAKRGYMRCTVTEKSWTTDMRTTEFTDRSGATTKTDVSFVVENGKIGANRA